MCIRDRAVAASAVPSSQSPVEVPCQPPAASPVRATPTEPIDPVVREGEAAVGPSVSADCFGGSGHPPRPAATPPGLDVQNPTTIHLGDAPGDPTKQRPHGLRADHRETTGDVQPVETCASTRRWQRHQDFAWSCRFHQQPASTWLESQPGNDHPPAHPAAQGQVP